MRILHTMIRVDDLQRAVEFYTQVLLGMKLLRKADYPGGRFTNAADHNRSLVLFRGCQ